MAHPQDRTANATDAETHAYLLLVGMGRARDKGLDIPPVLARVGLPGWTVFPGIGGWIGRAGLETEPSAGVLLLGVDSGTAYMAAESLRAEFGEDSVLIVPLALGGPVGSVESLAPHRTPPATPSHWPPSGPEGRMRP